MFSRKNCVYSFFCCSFSESLYTKDYLSGIFFDGYLKQIEIQEEFIQKQKEMIEFLEDHISKITDIISGV